MDGLKRANSAAENWRNAIGLESLLLSTMQCPNRNSNPCSVTVQPTREEEKEPPIRTGG